MSKLVTPHGDDHPEAASKHLQDAGTLLAAGRADGTAYLSGYVVECSLKSIYQLETGKEIWGHDLTNIHACVTALHMAAGATTAKYIGRTVANILGLPISAWRPGMRYKAPHITMAVAQNWHDTASQVFAESVAAMRLDGVL